MSPYQHKCDYCGRIFMVGSLGTITEYFNDTTTDYCSQSCYDADLKELRRKSRESSGGWSPV